MRKLVRPAYPVELSALILGSVFVFSCFLSHGIFDARLTHPEDRKIAFAGMFLVGVATVVAAMIMWEELFFPVTIKQNTDVLNVHNHRKKLHTQALLYLIIPAIFTIIYFNFPINMFHFALWAGVCSIAPVAEKIFSGVKNYNDFLILSPSEIEYKNNEKEGKYPVEKVQYIHMEKDRRGMHCKLKLGVNNSEVIIDLDEMELEAFYDIIQDFLKKTYKNLLK